MGVTSVTISWTTDVGATSSVVFTGSNPPPSVTNIALVTSHSITITGLKPLTTYSYYVSSKGFNALSTSSSGLTFQTNVNPANNTNPPPNPLYTNLFNTDIVGFDGNHWWVGLSNGSSFQSATIWSNWYSGAGWQNFQVGDFNGDGKADIAGLDSAGNWWVQVSNGHNAFQYADVPSTIVPSGPWTRFGIQWPTNVTWQFIATGDFMGNGLTDIIGLDNRDEWYVAASDGSFFSPVFPGLWATWSTGVTWVDLQVGDFNGDGKMDIAGRTSNTSQYPGQWWVGLSTGTSFVTSYWATWSTAVTWTNVRVGDFNGDGLSDIIGNEAGQWWVGVSTGSSFNNSLWATWSSTVAWTNALVGDFNGDGKADITARDPNGNWWTGLSNGSSFAAASLWASFSTSVTWALIQTADFNGDGLSDIIGYEGGAWYVGLSTGTSFNVSLWTTWSTNVTWSFLQVGDVGT